MTQEEILEGNRLIAEFMGGKYGKGTHRGIKANAELLGKLPQHEIWLPIHGIVRQDTIELGKGKIMKYHSSWDWLMPVVEKIELYSSPNYYKEKATTEDFTVSCDILTDLVIMTVHFKQPDPNKQRKVKQFTANVNSSKIEAVYKAVLQFITWYNQNKPTDESN